MTQLRVLSAGCTTMCRPRADSAKRVCTTRKIGKGVLGGDYVKGISQSALQLARKAPIAYLEILSAIRGMGPFAKAFDVVSSPISGLQAYDLEKPAKLLYPVVAPLRNKIPRVGGVGMATNYRVVLAVDDN